MPDAAPQGLKDFLACRADAYTFEDGPLTWLDVSPRPNLAIKPGATPGTATLDLKVLGFTISLPAAIVDGRLSIDTSNQMFLPASAEVEVRRFVDGLNGWFGQNGRMLGPPTFGPAGMTLTKIPIPGAGTPPAPPVTPPVPGPPAPTGTSQAPAATEPSLGGSADDGGAYAETAIDPPVLPPTEVFGPGASVPAAGAGPPPSGPAPSGPALAGGSIPPPPEPPIPPRIDLVEDIGGVQEAFDPTAATEPEPEADPETAEPGDAPEPEEPRDAIDQIFKAAQIGTLGGDAKVVTPPLGVQPADKDTGGPAVAPAPSAVPPPNPTPPVVPERPVVGAGAPGGPAAPRGMGGLARWALAAAIIAALALGAFVMLNGGGPVTGAPGTPSPGASATMAPGLSAGPTASVGPTTAPTGPAAGATPNGVANGRFEIISDTTIDSCHHDYEVEFRVFDSSGNGPVYAGKPATFQVLDGDEMTAVVGPDGTWRVTFSETFTKTGSGCFSRLNPKVLTVDGQPAF